MKPLEGIRILDLTSVLLGPYATQLLGDMGADVIKVEAPSGDIVRQIGPERHAGMGAMFLHLNRSKRSLKLDLKQPKARDALLRLAAKSDVLMYNIRPQAMARLGLSYDAVAQINPRIIYTGMFGYSQNGPYAALPAYDDLIQGASGLSFLITESGSDVPRYVPLALVDRIVGISAVNAVLAALLHREKSGDGQQIDVPMFETMVSLVMADHMGGLTFEPFVGEGGYARLLSVDRRPYRTLDGYLCVMIYTDKHWHNFFEAIGRSELLNDKRFDSHATRSANIRAIYAEVSGILMERKTEEWMALLRAADLPVMPLHSLESLLTDPHLSATNFFETVDHPTEGLIRSMRVPSNWSKTQPAAGRFAPGLGEHSGEILAELGYNQEEIESLLQ